MPWPEDHMSHGKQPEEAAPEIDVTPLSGRRPIKFAQRKHIFALEYPRDLNGEQAAIRAGYSPDSARTQASKLLGDPVVMAEIAASFARREKRTEIDIDLVVTELAKLALSSTTDAVSWDKDGVTVKDSATLPPEVLAAISEVSEVKGKVGSAIKVKMHDKLPALTTLGRHLGMFTEKVEFTGQVDVNSPVYKEMSLETAIGLRDALRAQKAIEGEGSVGPVSEETE